MAEARANSRNAPPRDLGVAVVVQNGAGTEFRDVDAVTDNDEDINVDDYFIVSPAIGVRLRSNCHRAAAMRQLASRVLCV